MKESNVACFSEIGTSYRYEAVTLPEKLMNMEVEQLMIFSEADATRFRGMVIPVTCIFRKIIIFIQYNNYHIIAIFFMCL